MNSTDTKEHFLKEFNRLEQNLAGNHLAWLREKRRAAIDKFMRTGLPTVRDEMWKYTKVTALEKRPFAVSHTATSGVNEDELSKYFIADSFHCLVFVDGVFSSKLSRISELPNQVIVDSLWQWSNKNPEQVKKYLTSLTDDIPHGFAALNSALMVDGAAVYIPKNTVVAEPIHLLFVATNNQENQAYYPHNVIVAEANSQATIVEHYIGLHDSTYFTNAISECHVHENAHLTHYKVQEEGMRALHIGSTQVKQHRDSTFISRVYSYGGSLVRSDTNVVLADEHTNCDLTGLFVTRAKQHMDFHTCIEHAKPHGKSREYYKGILADYSRGVFNGKVFVHKNAQHTDADQKSKNILLADTAEIDTKPELEIYADDVKCSHGATVGNLADEAIFYLRTRGLDLCAAKNLMLYAFASEIIDVVSNDNLRQYLKNLLLRKIPTNSTE